ncbi:pilus assembly protein CpaF [Desulfitispora alkaliphila]|uniref:CpaF family protein n=1 Tax=Desulfitispora alkaliphila TaxID=622674 RepID=UPI003D1BE667
MKFHSGKPEIKNSNEKDIIKENTLLVQLQKKAINEIDTVLIQQLDDYHKIKNYIEALLDSISEQIFPTITNKDKEIVAEALIDEFSGLGPIKKLMSDDTVSEIMVNGSTQVYIERNGVLELTDVKFRDDDHVIQIIDKIVAPIGRRIDESSPMVDARLPDGSRVNAIIPPISLTGPTITIRKFAKIPLTIEKLISLETLSKEMAEFLKRAIESKVNILVAGGTGSGKTVLLNVLSSFIPSNERIITIEDAAELQLVQPHVISLESRPSNIEEKGEITIKDLVKNSLRMRPNRIIIGEVRGAEALDMLQAMNTGHSGSLSTIHANSPRDALSRLETMVLYAGIDLPLRAIKEQIVSAINLVIYLQRFADGTRKVTDITEVVGLEGDVYALQDIFKYEQTGYRSKKLSGHFVGSLVRPRIFDKFDAMGIKN